VITYFEENFIGVWLQDSRSLSGTWTRGHCTNCHELIML
jgi:hypothetical protein